MNSPLDYFPLFFVAIIFGATMIIEGFLIVVKQKQIIPLPSKVLYWISVGISGKEKSTQWFSGKNTPENNRTYAFLALIFGGMLVLSSFISLNWILSQLRVL
jgi:hypothetical protein